MSSEVKEIIADKLAYFLLNEKIKPERIKIEVHYKHSVAKLVIDEDRLKELLERGEKDV